MKIKKMYSVYIICNNYLSHSYRIGVFKNFTKAMAFVKKTFYGRGEYPSYSLEWNNITNLESGDYEISSVDSFGQEITESYDVREVKVLEELFVVDEYGNIASIGDFQAPNYIQRDS